MSVFCRSMMTGMRNYHYHATSGGPVYRFNNIKKTNNYHSTTTVSSRSFAFPWYFTKSLPSLNKMPQATQVFLVFLDTLGSVSEYWLSIPWLVSFLSSLIMKPCAWLCFHHPGDPGADSGGKGKSSLWTGSLSGEKNSKDQRPVHRLGKV